MTAHVPSGWPPEVPPPEVDGWELAATEWLFDAAPSHFRLEPLFRKHPVLLARRVVEQATADVHAARNAWIPASQYQAAGLPVEAHPAVTEMLRREGPVLAARLASAKMIAAAMEGKRWVPRL